VDVFTCIICQFNVVLDDAVVSSRNGRCICLRCYLRETGADRPMAPALRKDLSLALGGIPGME
jgi:hypothetical protein